MNMHYIKLLITYLIITLVAVKLYLITGAQYSLYVAAGWVLYTGFRAVSFSALTPESYEHIDWIIEKQTRMVNITFAVGITAPLFLEWGIIMALGIVCLAFELQIYNVMKKLNRST